MKTPIVLWHPGASTSTSDVASGLSYGLEQAGVQVIPYRTDVHMEHAGRMLTTLHKRAAKGTEPPTQGDMVYHANIGILERALRARWTTGAPWVVAISGMYQHPDFVVMLRQAGMQVAAVLTESPYNMPQEQRFASLCNVAFTNERTAVDDLRQAQPHTHYLAHAWHPAVHTVMAAAEDVEAAAHDVVFVGTYFEERVKFLADMDWSGINLGLYGGVDGIDMRSAAGRKLKPYIAGGYTKNAVTAALYRRAKVGLNLTRTSIWFGPTPHITHRAESLNPRCYELAATGCYFVTDDRAEGHDIFGEWLPTFTDAHSCSALIRAALQDDGYRARVAAELRQRVEPHRWDLRAREVIAHLDAYDATSAGQGAPFRQSVGTVRPVAPPQQRG